MRKIIVIFILSIFSIVCIPNLSYAAKNNCGRRNIKSYTKKNGTHVKAHQKKVHYGTRKK